MKTLILNESGDFKDIAHLFHFVELLFIGLVKLDFKVSDVNNICIPHWPDPSWKGKEQKHNEWIINNIFPNVKVIHKIDETHENILVDRGQCEKGNIMNKCYAKYIRVFDPYKWSSLLNIPSQPSPKPIVTYIDRQSASRRKLPPDMHNKLIHFLYSQSDITFQPVKMEKLSFEEQVNVAQKTDLLIGVHGNGLTHTAFMRPHRSVCEIFVPGVPFIWDYYTMSKMMGHEYLCIFNSNPSLPYMFNLSYCKFGGNTLCETCDFDPRVLMGMISQIKEEKSKDFEMECLGTDYGGWWVPTDMDIQTVYSVGVGEDISFDIHLQSKYNCDIYLMDPTPRAWTHFKEFLTDCPYSGNIQKDYIQNIKNTTVNKSKFHFIPKGLWNEEGELKFYKQSDPNCVSQSLVGNMFSNEYDLVPVTTLPKDKKIDLLKMDIEGAECKVLEHMIDNNIFPKYLLIEFDLFIKGKDMNNETQTIINKLLNVGYFILKNDKMNITFVKTN